MKNHKTQDTGKEGEERACRYLQTKGFEVIGKNLRYSHLELDIVCLKGKELHFVEVKCRRTPVMAEPQENVGAIKQKRVAAAANAFLHSEDRVSLPENLEIFFDVVAVTIDGSNFEIEYYPHAFIPIYA